MRPYILELRATTESHLLGEERDIGPITYAVHEEGPTSASQKGAALRAILCRAGKCRRAPDEITLTIK